VNNLFDPLNQALIQEAYKEQKTTYQNWLFLLKLNQRFQSISGSEISAVFVIAGRSLFNKPQDSTID
jgi:hypothetical protein